MTAAPSLGPSWFRRMLAGGILFGASLVVAILAILWSLDPLTNALRPLAFLLALIGIFVIASGYRNLRK